MCSRRFTLPICGSETDQVHALCVVEYTLRMVPLSLSLLIWVLSPCAPSTASSPLRLNSTPSLLFLTLYVLFLFFFFKIIFLILFLNTVCEHQLPHSVCEISSGFSVCYCTFFLISYFPFNLACLTGAQV